MRNIAVVEDEDKAAEQLEGHLQRYSREYARGGVIYPSTS